MHDALLALWFFIPAGVANMAPVFAAKIPGIEKWDAPMDGGVTFRGKPLLGTHKTWRGLVAGIIAATLIFWLQKIMVLHIGGLADFTSSIDYAHLSTLLMGLLFGIGALGGDAIKSFFKRQLNVPSGHSWFPFDQIDYIIGGALATAFFAPLTIAQYAWVVAIWLVLHVIVSYIGYLLHLKERPI